LARLFRKTLLPPGVRLFFLKPWVLVLFLFLGWYVNDISFGFSIYGLSIAVKQKNRNVFVQLSLFMAEDITGYPQIMNKGLTMRWN